MDDRNVFKTNRNASHGTIAVINMLAFTRSANNYKVSKSPVICRRISRKKVPSIIALDAIEMLGTSAIMAC